MPNEHKRSTEIFRCSLNSLRKFSIFFAIFGYHIIFKNFVLGVVDSGKHREPLKRIKRQLFSVNLGLKLILIFILLKSSSVIIIEHHAFSSFLVLGNHAMFWIISSVFINSRSRLNNIKFNKLWRKLSLKLQVLTQYTSRK